MHPDQTKRIHRELRTKSTPDAPVQEASVPTAASMPIARMQKDESLESFFDRCHATAAPLYAVSAVYRASKQFRFDMNERTRSATHKSLRSKRASPRSMIEDWTRALLAAQFGFYLIGIPVAATHCHFPSGILTHVSTYRS